MSDFIIMPVVGLILLVGVAAALLWLRDWVTRPTRKEMAEFSRQCTERLLNPDLAAVERHFGHPLPTSLRALYGNREDLLRGEFETAAGPEVSPEQRWYVAFYQPADAASAADVWPGLESFFAFADDGAGNGYLVDPREEDPAVWFHDHETGERTRVCDHLSQFLTWPRWSAGA